MLQSPLSSVERAFDSCESVTSTLNDSNVA